jgi:flagellar protein FliL
MADQEEAPAATEEAPVKSGPKGFVLIGVLVLSLLAGGAGGALMVGPMIARKSGYLTDSGAAHGDSAASGKGQGEGGKEGAVANLHLIDNLVLNPAGSGGSRFLMLAAAVEVKDASMVEELKSRDAEARDIVLRVMGGKTVEMLSRMTYRDSLKAELADSLGTLFTKDPAAIRRIYFPQFVIQ